MKDISPTNKWFELLLQIYGIAAIFFLSIPISAHYIHHIHVPLNMVTFSIFLGCTFLYMCYEHFKTVRLFAEIQEKIRKLEEPR